MFYYCEHKQVDLKIYIILSNFAYSMHRKNTDQSLKYD